MSLKASCGVILGGVMGCSREWTPPQQTRRLLPSSSRCVAAGGEQRSGGVRERECRTHLTLSITLLTTVLPVSSPLLSPATRAGTRASSRRRPGPRRPTPASSSAAAADTARRRPARMTVWLETLWNILQDDACKEYIHWNDSGDGFVISSIRASPPPPPPPPPPPARTRARVTPLTPPRPRRAHRLQASSRRACSRTT